MTEEFDDQKSMRGLDEYWAMVVRRRWWIIGPLFLGWLIVFASAWIIPPKYTSETVILVEQQKVPEQFVMPNVQVDLQERLQSITQPGVEPVAVVGHHQQPASLPGLVLRLSGRSDHADAQGHQARYRPGPSQQRPDRER